MIVSALGLPGLSVLETSYMLNTLGLSYGVVDNGKLKHIKGRVQKQSFVPVIFTSAESLVRTYKKFKSARVVALVCDTPWVLHYEIGLPLGGADIKKSGVLFSTFGLKELRSYLLSVKSSKDSLDFYRDTYSLIGSALKEYSASSLSSLQTLLYKIKDIELRGNVSKAIKKWIMSDRAYGELEPKLRKCLQEKALDNMRLVLTSKDMKNFRKAVCAASVSPDKTDKVAKTYKVSAFDIKYIISTNV